MHAQLWTQWTESQNITISRSTLAWRIDLARSRLAAKYILTGIAGKLKLSPQEAESPTGLGEVGKVI